MKRISDCCKYQMYLAPNNCWVVKEIKSGQDCPLVYMPITGTDGNESVEDWMATVVAPGQDPGYGENIDLVFFAHPYYGLRDSKGWLTRYPNKVDNYVNKLISREWIAKFLELGGCIDGCGVWGISPNASWVETQSPEAILNLLNLEHASRWDNIQHNIFLICKAGLIISDDINWASFKALALGVRRMHTCNSAGIVFAHKYSIMQLGWMKENKWNYFVAQNATKYPNVRNRHHKSEIAYGDFYDIPLTNVYEEIGIAFDDSKVTNPIWIKAKTDFQKYSNRAKLHQAANNTYVAPVLHSSKVFTRLIEINYLNLNTSDKQIVNTPEFRDMYYRINTSYTTAGTILYSGNMLIQKTTGTLFWQKPLKVRQVGLYNVASATYAVQKGTFGVEYKKVVFAWTDSFQNHVEGSTVKEAITKLEGKRRIKGLVMSLNDIRTNASFCFAGTKQFLADRMRHVYNLVKDFSSWSELPEEIANIQWELASRDIFAGYPEP